MVIGKVKSITVHICTVCETQLTKCSLCGKWFEEPEKVDCKADGLRHICSFCME